MHAQLPAQVIGIASSYIACSTAEESACTRSIRTDRHGGGELVGVRDREDGVRRAVAGREPSRLRPAAPRRADRRHTRGHAGSRARAQATAPTESCRRDPGWNLVGAVGPGPVGRLPPHPLPRLEHRRVGHRVGPRPSALPLPGRPGARLPLRAPLGAAQRGHRRCGHRAAVPRHAGPRAAPQPRRPGSPPRGLSTALRVPRRRALGDRAARARMHPQGARPPRHAVRRDRHGRGRGERHLRVGAPSPRAGRLRRGARAQELPSRAGLHPRVGGRLRGFHALRAPPAHGAPRGPRPRRQRVCLLRRRGLRAPSRRCHRRHRCPPRVRRVRVRAVHAAGGWPRGARGREGGAAGVRADAAALLRHERAAHQRRQRPGRSGLGHGRARRRRGLPGEVRRHVRCGRRDRHGQARGGRARRGHEHQGARRAHRAQHWQGEEGAGRHDVRHLRHHGTGDDGARDAVDDGAVPVPADGDHTGERRDPAQRRRRLPGLAEKPRGSH